MSDSFYRDFEDRFRGSRELILWRLSVYLPFIRSLTGGEAAVRAVDLGCGRGEWLELLGQNGVDASGVDLDAGMLAACHERGLAAREADALATLQALPDASLALVSAFHLVEHVPFDVVRALVREALRVLTPGGLLIFETPNADNLAVGACSFYLDPSHRRPVPSALLGFVAEHTGFARSKVLPLQEAAELRGDAPITLDDVLRGVSPDYAVVAQKHAAPEALAALDEPFAADYGVTLSLLAQRYERQAGERAARSDERLAGAEGRLENAEGRLENAEGRLVGAEGRLVGAEGRLVGAEGRLESAERRAALADDAVEQISGRLAGLEGRLEELLHSRSWRITAPLRWLTEFVRRFWRRLSVVVLGGER